MPDVFTPEQIAQLLEAFFKAVGTRQYIGARYVPIFGRKGETSIEWDNSAPYEPLTVVLHQGNSFTSRQYVPAGVEITNEEFWANTGNYNAQIEQYRREVADAVQQAQTAFDAANAAQGDIDTLLPKASFDSTNTVKQYIDDKNVEQNALLPAADFSSTNTVKKYVDDNVTTLDGKISALAETIDEQHKGIIVIGDSYGEGYTPDGAVRSWVTNFTNAVTQYDYTVFSKSRGGSGFWNAGASYRFATLLGELLGTMSDTEKASVGCVIVGGGYNDREQSANDIGVGMAGFRDYIINNLPNVRRVLIFPFGMGVEGLTTGDHADFTYQSIVTMNKNYIEQCGNVRLGTVVANSCMVLRRNLYFSSDYVHPNENGQFLISRFVIDAFFGNGYNTATPLHYNSTYNLPITYDEGITANNPLSIITNGDSFTIYRETNSIQFTFATPIPSLALNASPIDLATVKDAAVQYNYADFRIPITCMVRYNDGAAKFYIGTGAIQFRFGKLSLIIWSLNATANNFATVTNVDQINCQIVGNTTFNGLYLR